MKIITVYIKIKLYKLVPSGNNKDNEDYDDKSCLNCSGMNQKYVYYDEFCFRYTIIN